VNALTVADSTSEYNSGISTEMRQWKDSRRGSQNDLQARVLQEFARSTDEPSCHFRIAGSRRARGEQSILEVAHLRGRQVGLWGKKLRPDGCVALTRIALEE